MTMTERRLRVRRTLFGIRSRVVVWYLVLFAALLLLALLTVQQVLLVRLDDEVTATLTQEAEELRLLAGGVDPITGEPFGTDADALFATFFSRNVPAEGEALIAVIGDEVVQMSPESVARPLLTDALIDEWMADEQARWGESPSVHGRVRWLSVPVVTGDSTAGRFVIIDLIGRERDEIGQAVRVTAAASAVVLLLASIIGWATTGRILAPIGRLTRTAQSISDTDLSARIPVETEDEVAELTTTFNEMLDRLEGAFAGQRTFMNDVGHELRTPITIVRGQLELLPEDPAERTEAIAVCLDELDRMGRYVGDLITLAKSEQPDFLDLRPVDLAEITDGLERRGRAMAPDRRWTIEQLAPVEITADPERLTQAMVNLLANAVHHTTIGDEIRVGSAVERDEVRLWVTDTGPGVAAEDRDRIFERFGRGGDTASRRQDGVGLGLAIVTAIAQAHGGTIRLDSEPGHGATFSLVIPAPGASAPDLTTELELPPVDAPPPPAPDDHPDDAPTLTTTAPPTEAPPTRRFIP